MKAQKYLHTLDYLREKNRLLIIALVLMCIFNVYNWASLQQARKTDKIALVPLAGGSGMWVGNGEASPQYIRAMARYITYQIGNYTAASIRRQLQELLLLYPPERIGAAQTKMEEIATDVERFPSIASMVILIGKNPMKFNDSVIQVQVSKQRLTNGQTTQKESVYYCISYRIDATEFRLLNISERGGQYEDACLLDTDPAADRNS